MAAQTADAAGGPLDPRAGIKAAALQWDVKRGQLEANLAAASSALSEATEQGARVCVLPEVWATSFPEARGQGGLLEAARAGEEWAREASARCGMVIAGTHLAAGEGGRFRNRLTVWDAGELILEYDKVHLFSPTAETEVFTAGDRPPAVVESSVGRLAGVVCYDLRFGELFAGLVEAGVEWVLVPAQWPVARAAHWRALAVGRAVECQAVLVAGNRTGVERVGARGRELVFGGNSLIADGHGRVLAEGAGADGAVVAEAATGELARLRVRVPVRKDRRVSLYRSWDGGHAGAEGAPERG